jgi:hypothetical protein
MHSFVFIILSTCPFQSNVLDFVVLTVLGDLCVIPSVVHFVLLRSKIFVSTLFENTRDLCTSLEARNEFHACAEQLEKLFYICSALESRQYGGDCSVICY